MLYSHTGQELRESAVMLPQQSFDISRLPTSILSLLLIFLFPSSTRAEYNQTIDDQSNLVRYAQGEWFPQSLAQGDTYVYLSWARQGTMMSSMTPGLEAVLQFNGSSVLLS
jgi:hypothetical protein